MIVSAPNWRGTAIPALAAVGRRSRGLGDPMMGPPADPSVAIPASGSAIDQLQAEIDALFSYTGAGAAAPETIAPAGSSSTIFPGVPNLAVYIGVGAIAYVLFSATGGRRR